MKTLIKTLSILVLVFASAFVYAEPVNVNTADAATIADNLNGIGLSKAQAIVDYRSKFGAFKTADDLVNVKGIGVKTVAKIRHDVLLKNSKKTKK